MYVDTSPRYEVELNKILDFIGENNPINALNFVKKLEAKINALPHFPYKCRRSLKFNDLAKTRFIATEEKSILDELYQKIILNGTLDGMQSRAAERSLQIMIENLIGRCKKILQHYDSPIIPLSGYDSAEILKNVGFFEEEEFNAMRRLFGFRNAMVHDYMDLDRLIVKAIVEKQEYFLLFDFLMRDFTESDIIRKRIGNYAF